jgi:hypothetical protein
MQHLPRNNTPRAASSPLTNIGHNPRQLKLTEKHIPNGRSNFTIEKKMVNGLSIHFTRAAPIATMMCHFLKLFIVKIFPRAANQAKNATLKGIFHGKRNPSLQAMTL